MESPNRGHIWSKHHFDAGIAEPIHPTRRKIVGFRTTNHHSRDSGGNDRIDAGWRPSVMITWFEGHPRGATSSGDPSDPEGLDLCVGTTRMTSSSFGNHLAIDVGDDAADGGIRLGFAVSTQRPASGSLQHEAVVIVG
jgi:hypothetical protein